MQSTVGLHRNQSLLLCLVMLLAVSTPVAADCGDTQDRCITRADSQEDRCVASCDRNYRNDFDGWERCFDRCTATNDSATASCEQAYERCQAVEEAREQQASQTTTGNPGSSSSGRPKLHGSQESGQDGCYFGECPDGTNPSPNPPQDQQPTRPRPNPPQQTPPQQQPQQPASTAICQTPTFWCRMYQRGPVGYPCYCASVYGPINGQTVPE